MVADETFAPTSGRFSGVIGLGIAVLILGLAVFSDDSGIAPWGIAAALLVAAVSWTALLKPGLKIAGGALVLRNMFATVTIPLRRVDSVAVRQVTAVWVGEQRFVSAAVGRSRMQMRRDNPPPGRAPRRSSRFGGLGFGIFGLSAHTHDAEQGSGQAARSHGAQFSYGYYVQEKIQRAVTETKTHARGEGEPDEVRRRVAWLEIVLVAGTLIATAVLLFG